MPPGLTLDERLFLVFVLETALKATLVVLLAAGAAWLLRRASAAARAMAWLCALASLVLMPLVSSVLPQPLTLEWSLVRPDYLAESPALQAKLSGSAVPASPTAITPGTAPKVPVAAGSANKATAASLPIPPPVSAPAVPRSFPWTLLVRAFWYLGTLFVLAQIWLGFRAVRRLSERSAPAAPDSLSARIHTEASQALGLVPDTVALRQASSVGAMTWGWRRPVILLPDDAATWEPGRLQAVLLHELAHIARRDWPAQMLANVVCALHWWHPLVWWAAARLRAESERACDDRVLLAGIPSTDYARHLLDTAVAVRETA